MNPVVTGRATRLLRLSRMVWHFVRGLTTAACFPLMSPAHRREHVRQWSRRMLALLGVKLHPVGRTSWPADTPVLLVANHVSWLDIFVINAVLPVRFVAKSEVRNWPGVGWLSARTGTVFIARGRRLDAVRVNALVTAALVRGERFAVFPEGTTTDGSRVLSFHGALLQPVISAGGLLQPVALRFERRDGSLCTEAAFDGDKSVWDTLRAILAQPAIHARVEFLVPLTSSGMSRQELATAAHDGITRALHQPRRGSHTETGHDPRAAMQ